MDVFLKGLEEYKKKMSQLFHLLDLDDIILDDLEGARGGEAPPVEADAIANTSSGTNPLPLLEPQEAIVGTQRPRKAPTLAPSP